MREAFRDFVRAVHGHAPFPWQVRAAEALVSGAPLDALCVPTGAGKTSILDAAVFAIARGAPWQRVVYTVDRRLVVDGVTEHANRIVAAIEAPAAPGVQAVADGLGGRLRVVRLRGGVPMDDEWVLYPEEPCILVTTVDQAGSRLLFRGYGVSARQAPIHAALMGHRALHVVDEAHLSRAYLQTLRACRGYGAQVSVIEMTATPSRPTDCLLALDDDDLANPVLDRRLRASKRARLMSTSPKKLSAALVAEALALRERGAKVIGVVVNTVARAREVYESLRPRGDAVLLTGRVRPHERDCLVEELLPRMRAGRLTMTENALYVVATQTIEVGADLDFDALVTECASVDALRQRFGRLDRLGNHCSTDAAIVFAPRSDKVYGKAYDTAWQWMEARAVAGVVDFGLDAFSRYPAPAPDRLLPVPPLAPNHVELLSITGVLAPQLDISPWLHGIERPGSDVTIVWRADLDAGRPEDWGQIVALLPPLASEALNLPIHAARAWLASEDAPDISDIAVAPGNDGFSSGGRHALRWDGEHGQVVTAREIRPGDTLVVPSAFGGCDAMGWNPASTSPVPDLAEAVREQAGRPRRRRLHPALPGDPALVSAARRWADLAGREPESLAIEIDEFEHLLNEAERALRELLDVDAVHALEPYPDRSGVVVRYLGPEFGQVLDTGRPIPLDEHLEGVARWARQLAEASGEDGDLLASAGLQHDEGKGIAAFQTMLHGSPIHSRLLAKSGLTGSAAQAAWRNSGLPRRFRHEAASVALTNCENPLLRHLIGTHHGQGRPWFPVCEDAAMPGSEFATAEGGWIGQFFSVRDDHGPWHLAWLETLLRVADARRSIEEQS